MTADIVVKGVMGILILASLLTWTILLFKSVELARAKARVRRALRLLATAPSLEDGAAALGPRGPVGLLAEAALAERRLSASLPASGIKERVDSALTRLEAAEARRINFGTGVLASIGSTTPFIGLFGTVWGIMNAFISISRTQTTNLSVVAPGIAEALFATAIGLVAAIPAVVVYNHFARGIGGYKAMLADAGAAIVRLLSRDLDRAQHRALRPSAASGSIRQRSKGDAARLDDGEDLAENHDINVTPFIDVMLVLLIIFMVTAPLSTVDVPVDLPSSTAPPQPRPDKPVFVSVKADRSVVLGNDTIAPEALPAALDGLTSGISRPASSCAATGAALRRSDGRDERPARRRLPEDRPRRHRSRADGALRAVGRAMSSAHVMAYAASTAGRAVRSLKRGAGRRRSTSRRWPPLETAFTGAPAGSSPRLRCSRSMAASIGGRPRSARRPPPPATPSLRSRWTSRPSPSRKPRRAKPPNRSRASARPRR